MAVRTWKVDDEPDQGSGRWRSWIWVLALLGLVNAVLLGVLIGRSLGSDDPVALAPVTPEPVQVVVTATPEPPTPEPSPEPTAVPEPTAEPTVAPEPTATPEPTAEPEPALPPLDTLPERGAIFRPPTLFLEGPVQTAEIAQQFYDRAVEVVGEENVVNNYVIRADAPEATDGNVRVEQAVLFQTGSAAIAEDFIPVLNLGIAVMSLNPQVTMVVEGHTDSQGSDQANQQLSIERAQAVVDYLVAAGIDPDRLEPIGLGESQPVAPNDTAEGRQINRRIEVQLIDLLVPAEPE